MEVKMKLKMLLIVTALLSLNASADERETDPITQDGIVNITWKEVDKYRDVKGVNEVQSRYEQHIFNTLTKQLNKSLSKVLKPNQTIQMQVTDVDLAGDVRPTFAATAGSDIRVVTDLYPPRLTFSYQILEDGKVIMVGDEKLQDMSFLQTSGIRSSQPFHYETQMLEQWVKQKISPLI